MSQGAPEVVALQRRASAWYLMWYQQRVAVPERAGFEVRMASTEVTTGVACSAARMASAALARSLRSAGGLRARATLTEEGRLHRKRALKMVDFLSSALTKDSMWRRRAEGFR